MRKKLFYVVFKTAAGWVGILGSATGLRRTTLPQTSKENAMAALEIHDAKQNKRYFQDLVHRFKHYFTGHQVEFPDKLDISKATPFQRAVWQATRKIPYGQTRRYAWVARKTGKPYAARAAGQALGKNPLPIIVPCHRVIYSNGGLGGYTGGLAVKKRLLVLESGATKSLGIFI
jgi:methylated-DNA-[protein]-cysteine S-methyltransferase